MVKLKRRSKLAKALDTIEKVPFKKKVVKYKWNEHHVKLNKDNQIILRQVANQDNFELSIMHGGYQKYEQGLTNRWKTIRMTREDVYQVYKMMQELFITLNNQDDLRRE